MAACAHGTSPTKRRSMDIMKLMMSDYKVELAREDGSDFDVLFHGPEGTAYKGGVWKVHVGLPVDYPYQSPSIGFKNVLFHPNIDENSGTVCLDVINQTWSPMFDLVNIFDVFLPQLLAYPNPSDPLNNEAASLLLDDPEMYNRTVQDYVKRFANCTEFEKPKVSQPAPTADVEVSSTEHLVSSADASSNDMDDELSSFGEESDDGFDLDI